MSKFKNFVKILKNLDRDFCTPWGAEIEGLELFFKETLTEGFFELKGEFRTHAKAWILIDGSLDIDGTISSHQNCWEATRVLLDAGLVEKSWLNGFYRTL